jgi:hypothetical protein
VAPYRIIFHAQNGEPLGESIVDMPHDEAAIELAGARKYPHELHIWQGSRFVALVPPWSPSGRR